MKKIKLTHLRDAMSLSSALHQAMSLLSHAPVSLTATHLCNLLGIHNSQFTRMKLLHKRPQYFKVVSECHLYKTLSYLLDNYPALQLYLSDNNKVLVRLESPLGLKSANQLCPCANSLRKTPKPGSTRWFLEHFDTIEAEI